MSIHTFYFFTWNTPSEDIVASLLEEVRVIPIVSFCFVHEFLLSIRGKTRWYLSIYAVVGEVGIPGTIRIMCDPHRLTRSKGLGG